MKGETRGRGELSSRVSSAMRACFVEAEIIDAGIGGGEKLGDGALVDIGILPHVERREVEAEDVDRAAQRPQPAAREDRAAVGFQRVGDDREVGGEFGGLGVRLGVGQRLAQRHDVIELARGLGEARIEAGDGAPIGLVAPGGRAVGRAIG